jgi:hypothetical protein
MNWFEVEATVLGQRHTARYRRIGSLIEVNWNDALRATSVGSLRDEIAAAAMLKQMVLRGDTPKKAA